MNTCVTGIQIKGEFPETLLCLSNTFQHFRSRIKPELSGERIVHYNFGGADKTKLREKKIIS